MPIWHKMVKIEKLKGGKRMKLKDVADSLRLSVSEFAKLAGYSRQELYFVVAGKKKANKNKFDKAINSIKSYSKEMYKKDIEKAMNEKSIREKLISEFELKGVRVSDDD